MVDKSEEVAEKPADKSDKKTGKKVPPSILILFQVQENTPWAVYPRLFNTEETALSKLEQSYPFVDHFFVHAKLP